jgi:2-keto-4-pentenoate hydratase
MKAEAIDRAARIFLDARLGNYQIPGLPAECRPTSLEEAAAVRERLGVLIPEEKVGYLLGLTNEYMQRNFDTDSPYWAPILASNLRTSPADLRADDLLTMSLECEVAFRLARDLPARDGAYTPDEVAAAVATMHPSVEVVNAHLENWLEADLFSLMADNGTDGPLVLGAGVADWQSIDRPAIPVTLTVDGTVRARGTGAKALGDPLTALTWCANALSARGTGLRAGEVINTGTCTEVHHASAGERVVADFGPLGAVHIHFTV